MADDTPINDNIDMLDNGLEAMESADTATQSDSFDNSASEEEKTSKNSLDDVSSEENTADVAEPDKSANSEHNLKKIEPENDVTPLEEPEDLVVEGFEFLSKEDADKARLDRHKIEILGQKVHSTKVSDLEAVYEKAISNKIFSTPVGWLYLAKLRDRLIQAGVQEYDLTPIPIEHKITRVNLKDEYHPRQYITPVKKKKDRKITMILLGAMNLILVIMVIVMFLIAYYSETDNIINYKQNVTNRYAEWEQSLKEREKAVRIKERDLSIEDDTGYASEFDVDTNTDTDEETAGE